MMTKRQFAKCIVDREIAKGNCTVTRSSCFAVSADFLNLLSPEESEYAKSRSGIEYTSDNEHERRVNPEFLTIREILELLPDELPQQELKLGIKAYVETVNKIYNPEE